MEVTNQKMENSKITLSTVKSYGFTDKLIRELLPEPELVVNPHYRSGLKAISENARRAITSAWQQRSGKNRFLSR